MKKELQINKSGITLIALVITIIVMLILAGVAVNMAINSDGLFEKANQAVKGWNESVDKEKDQIFDLMGELIPRKISLTSNLKDGGTYEEGTELILTLNVEGYEGIDYEIRWQETTDGVTWTDIPGENGHELRIILRPEHEGVYWRALLNY